MSRRPSKAQAIATPDPPSLPARSRSGHPSPLLGASRVGGQPDLPPDIAWPTWKGQHETFVAQIDLAELPAMPHRDLLPAHGRMWIPRCLRVRWRTVLLRQQRGRSRACPWSFISDAADTSLVRTPFPADIDDVQKLPAQPLRTSIFNTVPDFEHPIWRTMPFSAGGQDFVAENVGRSGTAGTRFLASKCWATRCRCKPKPRAPDIEATFSLPKRQRRRIRPEIPAMGAALPGPRLVRRLQPLLHDPPRRPCCITAGTRPGFACKLRSILIVLPL